MKSLNILGNELRKLGINAEFDEWTGKIPKTSYWVYTYIEDDNDYETGKKSGVLILDGFTRSDIELLEQEKERILKYFEDYRSIRDNISIFLSSRSGKIVDTYDVELKKIQIDIDFKEWKGEV